MENIEILEIAKLVASKLFIRIPDTALILKNMKPLIGTITILYNKDFILWIDKHYIAYSSNNSADVVYVMVGEKHISEELRTVVKMLKGETNPKQKQTLFSIKEQLLTAQESIRESGAKVYLSREYDFNKERSTVKNEKYIITLCDNCARDYYNLPDYYIRAIYPRHHKESCTKCNGKGYDFIVKPKKEECR